MPSFDSGDDFVWIGGPSEGLGLLIILFEEAVDRGLEIGDRSEHAAFQSPLCQGREKTFDSVEPRCRSGREVKGPAGMAGEPLADLRMFMGGVIVDDRLDRLSRWSPLLDGVEEANELLMAMALHVAADYCAVEHIECGEQRCRAVSLVVVGHGSGATFLQRQTGLGAVKRLDLALFVERQNNGVSWRIDIEPDHVAQFVNEAWVVRKLELANPVGLETMAAPDPLDGTNTEARRLRHQDAGPVGRFAGWIAKRQGDNPLGRLAIERLDPRGPGLVAKQTLEPFFQEAFLPAPNASLGLAGSSHDLVRAGPIGREENNLGSPHVLLRDIAIVDEIFKPTPIGQRNGDGFSCAHRADLHMPQIWGIPIGT